MYVRDSQEMSLTTSYPHQLDGMPMGRDCPFLKSLLQSELAIYINFNKIYNIYILYIIYYIYYIIYNILYIIY